MTVILRFLQEVHMAAPSHRCRDAQYRAAVDAARYLPEGVWLRFPAAEEVHPEHACQRSRKTEKLLLKRDSQEIRKDCCMDCVFGRVIG